MRRLPLFRHLLEAEKKRLEALLRQVPQTTGLHLDAGSGTGDSLALFQESKILICADSSFAMLRQAQAPRKLVARAEGLPFGDHVFALVSAIGLLEYVREARTFFEEIRRVLQPEGFFLFTSSPPALGNYLRQMSSGRLYLRAAAEIEAHLPQTGWQKRGHERTWLQEQWLICPKEEIRRAHPH